MTNKIQFIVLAFVLAIVLPVSAQKKANDIVGFWLNQDADAKVEIYKSGDKYYGKIVWLKIPIDPVTKKEKLDSKNPDNSLKQRPILNLEILKHFVFDGDNEWNDGAIYDPKSGKTYSCLIKFEEANKLKIRGYIGVSLIGKTTYWTRTTKP
ncbi:MAG: DUF2147 domain-containing protein [Sphingobacteriia bacterium]|nr:DUF2147 domain-containing protein [Sphingobacteriia bacterium]